LEKKVEHFAAMMTYQDILIDKIEDDDSATIPHDSGKIAWPVVKETLIGTNQYTMSDLETAAKVIKVLFGLDVKYRLEESEPGDPPCSSTTIIM
jgi:hypothetical protein